MQRNISTNLEAFGNEVKYFLGLVTEIYLVNQD